mmetsp:Transcript_63114/g.73864  ORF Transcript_63114/g.73864 Transcript_63114/m.73864 type:complete len:80 (-) Transcript_63114:226-465(-)
MFHHLDGVGETYPDIPRVAVKEQYRGEHILFVCVDVGLILHQPGMDVNSVLAFDPVGFKGDSVFGGAAIAFRIVAWFFR